MKADLHCHSSYSDGTCSPKELIDVAKACKFDGLSITDHDSVKAFFEAYSYACDKNMILLPGVEISAQHQGESVHILGYSFDPANTSLSVFCETHKLRREKRNAQIVENLCKAGMPLTMEEVKILSPHADSYGRPHIALGMVKRGYVSSVLSAFTRYIGAGRSCYVEGEKWSVEEAIGAVHAAGGLAVLAHPQLMGKKVHVDHLLSQAFDGIEGYYGHFYHQKNERWCDEGKKRGLLITGGSDFHGSLRPDVSFGASYAPEDSFDVLYKHFLSHRWRS